VTGDPPFEDELDVVDALDRQVARSLLVADRTGPTSRYRPLESLPHFGEDALERAAESTATTARQATNFLALAETARRQQSMVEAAGAIGGGVRMGQLPRRGRLVHCDQGH
jgi:predicted ATPase